jgi:hypothetical protein
MELEDEYRTLLAREGLQPLLAAPDPAAVRAYVEGLSKQEREYEIPDGLLTPTHPPSDERAAVLRGIFTRLGERHLLQFADAWVGSLQQREPTIVELARAALTA